MLGDATDADVFALADDDLEAAVQVFHVRGGRIRGQRGWVVEKESEDLPLLVEHLLQQVYGDVDPEAATATRSRVRCSCPFAARRRRGRRRVAVRAAGLARSRAGAAARRQARP